MMPNGNARDDYMRFDRRMPFGFVRRPARGLPMSALMAVLPRRAPSRWIRGRWWGRTRTAVTAFIMLIAAAISCPAVTPERNGSRFRQVEPSELRRYGERRVDSQIGRHRPG